MRSISLDVGLVAVASCALMQIIHCAVIWACLPLQSVKTTDSIQENIAERNALGINRAYDDKAFVAIHRSPYYRFGENLRTTWNVSEVPAMGLDNPPTETLLVNFTKGTKHTFAAGSDPITTIEFIPALTNYIYCTDPRPSKWSDDRAYRDVSVSLASTSFASNSSVVDSFHNYYICLYYAQQTEECNQSLVSNNEEVCAKIADFKGLSDAYARDINNRIIMPSFINYIFAKPWLGAIFVFTISNIFITWILRRSSTN